MVPSILTHGVLVSAEAQYHHPSLTEHIFHYKIIIDNTNFYPVRIMSRYWDITDSGIHTIVEGEGVVGIQPLIQPGDKFEYLSGISLATEIGALTGHYNMLNTQSGEHFKVIIPWFMLITPQKLN